MEFVDPELGCGAQQRGGWIDMLREFAVIIQPPSGVEREDQMRRTALSQFVEIDNCLCTFHWLAFVNSFFLQQIPAFAPSVVENSRVPVIRCDDQRVCRRGSV